jgi:hypothetical protein
MFAIGINSAMNKKLVERRRHPALRDPWLLLLGSNRHWK